MSNMDKAYTDTDKTDDVKVLHSMGYAQELERRLSRFSNFAVSFSIICILSGGINSLPQATSGAGGIAIGIGWLVGCFVSLTFAVAMSQISSAYPTAGGLYHWGSILGNRGTGWVTAWLNLLGLITVLGAINVGTWTFFEGAFPWLNIPNNIWTQTIFLVIITGAQAIINHRGIKLTAQLTDFSGWLIFGGSILIGIVCLWAGSTWDIGRLFTFHNYSGDPGGGVWPAVSNWWVFALGLLMPIYTITGYDASAHTSEETLKAARSVPRAMVMSVVWSAIFGLVFLVPFVLMLPNMDQAAAQGWNVWFWAFDQQVNPTVKEIVYLVVFVAQLLCGLATVTSASRMIFAFSRDGGLPASASLSKVSPTYRTPVAAIWTAAVLSVLFVLGSSLISVAGTSAYTIVVSCTVIFLFLSFTFPIVLGAIAWGTPKWDRMGPWDLGRGVFLLFAVLSVLSMILIIILGIQPPNDKAAYIVIGFFVLTAIVWFGFEQRRFKGPPMGDIIARRQAMIAEQEKAVGEHH